MIYVIDNGGQYSDHGVYFVESDMTPSQVDEVLAESTYGHNPFIVFLSDVLEWRDPSAKTTIFGAYFGGDLAYKYESSGILKIAWMEDHADNLRRIKGGYLAPEKENLSRARDELVRRGETP